MLYADMTDEQLAGAVAKALGIERDVALRAVSSDDPDLGREWATSMLRRTDSHEQNLARLSHHRRALRSAVGG